MPVFYFHLKVGRDLQRDEIGLELPSVEAAYLEAFSAAQEMWTELLAERSDPTKRSFEIADETGRVLTKLPFIEVLERAKKGQAPPRHNLRNAHATVSRTTSLAASLTAQIQRTRRILEDTEQTLRRSSLQREGHILPPRAKPRKARSASRRT